MALLVSSPFRRIMHCVCIKRKFRMLARIGMFLFSAATLTSMVPPTGSVKNAAVGAGRGGIVPLLTESSPSGPPSVPHQSALLTTLDLRWLTRKIDPWRHWMLSMPIGPAASPAACAMGFARRASPALEALVIGAHGAVLGSWDVGAHAEMDQGRLCSLALQSRTCRLVVQGDWGSAIITGLMRLDETVGGTDDG